MDSGLDLLGDEGRVAVVAAPQDQVESAALGLVIEHGLPAMDAWHLACAGLVLPMLAERGGETAFATRDIEQGEAARTLGFASA